MAKLALTLIFIKWVPGDPSSIFLATLFTQKMLEGSGSMYSSILMLENMISSFYLKWIEFTRNCEFVPIYFGSPGTQNWNKIHNFTISCEFGPLQVK